MRFGRRGRVGRESLEHAARAHLVAAVQQLAHGFRARAGAERPRHHFRPARQRETADAVSFGRRQRAGEISEAAYSSMLQKLISINEAEKSLPGKASSR